MNARTEKIKDYNKLVKHSPHVQSGILVYVCAHIPINNVVIFYSVHFYSFMCRTLLLQKLIHVDVRLKLPYGTILAVSLSQRTDVD